MIAQVGAISANNEISIGKIIAEAMEKVGKDGVITVEEAQGLETTMAIVEGMQFDRGYLSPYFITDPDRMEVALENTIVVLNEKKQSNLRECLPIRDTVAKMGRPLIDIGDDVVDMIDTDAQTNHIRGHTGGFQFIVGQLAMRGRSRMCSQ